MKWSYGITTVPKRFNDLLPRTIESLHKAGFTDPWIFVDSLERLPPSIHDNYKTTYRQNVRTFGNWVLAAWELYLREPHADRYAIFQDDFVTYQNLRGYLERCLYPKQGYWNLYTFPHNEKPIKGWYPSDQLGKGAVALVFDNDTLRRLLATSYMVDRPLDSNRGHNHVDGGIVSALKNEGWVEYVHSPSLVQHTGEYSSMGNHRQPLAKSFRGEEFDALTLIEENTAPVNEPRPARVRSHIRIGLVGYNCNTGLGELGRQISTYCDVDTWLIKPHPNVPMNAIPEKADCIVCREGAGDKVDRFVRSVDAIVFCERPFYNDLIRTAKKYKKRLVCVPMMEWMPAGAKGWPQHVDLFICPTRQCYDTFKDTVPCVYWPWPVDTERFKFQPRTTCQKFLYISGKGGYKGRKCIDVVVNAKKLWPEMPLAVRCQVSAVWPAGTEILPSPQENSALYSEGDVLIAPHSVDGLGLEPMEAMSCGMPVVTTDGLPWNEIPSIGKITSTVTKQVVQRPVNWYSPQVDSLVSICKNLLGKDISEQSQQARTWAESMDWGKLYGQFEELVRHGKIHPES